MSDKNYKANNQSVVYNKVLGERDRSCFELYFEIQDRRGSSRVQ